MPEGENGQHVTATLFWRVVVGYSAVFVMVAGFLWNQIEKGRNERQLLREADTTCMSKIEKVESGFELVKEGAFRRVDILADKVEGVALFMAEEKGARRVLESRPSLPLPSR